MASAFFRLRKATGKNPQIIYVGYKFGLDQMIHPTGIKVSPKEWDFRKSRVKNVVTYLGKDEVNGFLSDLEAFVNGSMLSAKLSKRPLTKQELKQIVEDYLNPKPEIKTITLFEFIEKFIADSSEGRRQVDGREVSTRTVQRYRTTQDLLISFNKIATRKIDFKSIDIDFYKDFNEFMAKEKNYAPPTMGKHISTLKTFLKEATEEGINTNLKFQSKAFKVVEGESDTIALSDSELDKIYRLDLTGNERLEKVRDLFIIGGNTGLRFSDFTEIKPENIKKDEQGFYYIEKVMFKGKKKVEIPLNETVMEVLVKYNNVLPPAISNQKFNDYIKEVAKLIPDLHEIHFKVVTKGGKTEELSLPKWEMVSSHTARRSFCTNAYERGTPAISIMQISGHRTEKAFLKYIKTSSRKHAEIIRKHQ